ncbi:Copper chaperone CopZ [Ferrithrix thermotolerans DSM 19514]|uniref:Copper chaperone CopZ n=1 Tax=Ferrithrix thermotolerans DSM 19514 TaxID=1121881 RepID=A0A1M4X428_9ACTN|nr:heavy-metal-associated domain-containing protein [Ferrithrix thermotolerans]SHE88234.1 Copper chaperone CopZ [Ferrithrix thermotolerans DSM 19514]
METKIFLVEGMTCDHCVNAVTKEVSKVPNVVSVDVDLSSKKVTVTGDDLSDADIVAAVDEAGYDAVAI